MSQNITSEHNPWLKKYVALLGTLGTVFVFLAVGAALLSTFIYLKKAPSVEHIYNRNLYPLWTCALLWVPIVIQVIVFGLLQKKLRQTISDDKLSDYFKFYFWRMAASLAAYTVLWLLYVGVYVLNLGYWFTWTVSMLSLIGIILLLYIVVHATYLITKTSFYSDEFLLTEDEVRAKYDNICEALKTEPTGEVYKIRQWLLKDRDCKVHIATLKNKIRYLNIEHLTEALNRLISNSHFYAVLPKERKIKPDNELLPKDIEAVNRQYLNEFLLSDSSPTKTTDTKREKKDRAKQEKLAKQKSQRDGITMFPFYTMVFFFSVFLCIAYLFGFAFAFEDRYIQLEEPKGKVALFMTDDLLEDAGQRDDTALFHVGNFKNLKSLASKLHNLDDPVSNYLYTQLSPSTQNLLKEYDGSSQIPELLQNGLVMDLNQLLKGKSLFDERRFAQITLRDETARLLDQNPNGEDLVLLNRLLLEDAYPFEIARSRQVVSTHASIPVSYRLNKLRKVFYFDSGGAGVTTEVATDNPDKRMKRIALINKISLTSIVDLIKTALQKNSGVVRVELIGRADDNSVKKISYASNYEIALARVDNIRFLLQEQLIEEKVSPETLASIEWFESAFSNDETLSPKESQDSETSLVTRVLNNKFASVNTSGSKVPKEFTDNLDKESWNSGSKGWKDELRDFLGRLRTLSQKTVPLESLQEILDNIHTWDSFKAAGDVEQAKDLADKIDAELYQYEDPSGRKRVVEVYLYDTMPVEQQLANDVTSQPTSKRMALMDYLYFAMYTITTTGYGDIKPMTPYTKFLCTIANMTEIFFIVVFFNTLLSLKRGKEDVRWV